VSARFDDEPDVPRVKDVATVTVKDTVDGTKKRKKRGPNKPKAAITHTDIKVDPRVWATAKSICMGSQRIVIVSETHVMVVNR